MVIASETRLDLIKAVMNRIEKDMAGKEMIHIRRCLLNRIHLIGG